MGRYSADTRFTPTPFACPTPPRVCRSRDRTLAPALTLTLTLTLTLNLSLALTRALTRALILALALDLPPKQARSSRLSRHSRATCLTRRALWTLSPLVHPRMTPSRSCIRRWRARARAAR